MSLPILRFREPNIAELDDGVIIVVLRANKAFARTIHVLVYDFLAESENKMAATRAKIARCNRLLITIQRSD